MNLNKVFLIGRVAADPETRNTASGQNVSTLRMATNRVWNDRAGQKQEQAEFHTVVAWGKLAEILDKYVRRGQMIMIEGRIQTRSWQGNDGVKRYRTEIIAEGLQLGPKSANTGGATTFGANRPTTSDANREIKEEDIPIINQDDAPVTAVETSKDIDEEEIDLKDIPF